MVIALTVTFFSLTIFMMSLISNNATSTAITFISSTLLCNASPFFIFKIMIKVNTLSVTELTSKGGKEGDFLFYFVCLTKSEVKKKIVACQFLLTDAGRNSGTVRLKACEC